MHLFISTYSDQPWLGEPFLDVEFSYCFLVPFVCNTFISNDSEVVYQLAISKGRKLIELMLMGFIRLTNGLQASHCISGLHTTERSDSHSCSVHEHGYPLIPLKILRGFLKSCQFSSYLGILKMFGLILATETKQTDLKVSFGTNGQKENLASFMLFYMDYNYKIKDKSSHLK